MQMGTMTRDEAARHLAELQVHVNPTIHVYRVFSSDALAEQSETEPIILLYVNEFTFPSEDIWPLGFEPTPASGNYPTIIMDITPEQFESLKGGEILLPHNWRLGEELTPESLPTAGPSL